MTEKLKAGEVELFASSTPTWASGVHRLDVSHTVTDGTTPLLEIGTSPDFTPDFTIVVAGGADPLAPDDVLASYPPPGSRDASELMLPHVVFRRRTLPWEVRVGDAGAPWLALLLLQESEITTLAPPSGGVGLPTLQIGSPMLRRVLPTKAELPSLAHVRRVSTDDREFAGDDDGFVAVLIGNRLPRKPGAWSAFVVALDKVWDQPIWPGTIGMSTVSLPVLHSWRFEGGGGGDFEQLCAPLRTNTCRFGTSPTSAPGVVTPTAVAPLRLEQSDGTVRPVSYRSPLSGSPTGKVADADGFSGEAMFELGRLMALADGAMVAHLQSLRQQQWERVWWKTIYTHFANPLGANGPWSGMDGPWGELGAKLRAKLTDYLKKKGGGLPGGGGLGPHGGADEIWGSIGLGRVPGGGYPSVSSDIVNAIRAGAGGGFTDPTPAVVVGHTGAAAAIQPTGAGAVVTTATASTPTAATAAVTTGTVRPSAPVAPAATAAPAAPAYVDPRITSFLDKLRTASSAPSLLDRLRNAVPSRLRGGK